VGIIGQRGCEKDSGKGGSNSLKEKKRARLQRKEEFSKWRRRRKAKWLYEHLKENPKHHLLTGTGDWKELSRLVLVCSNSVRDRGVF